MKQFFKTQKLVRSYNFRTTFTGDKWEQNNMDWPKQIVEPLRVNDATPFARDLFRHAYNTDQMGYFFYCFDALDTYARENGGLPREWTPEFASQLTTLGLAPEFVEVTLPQMYREQKVRLVSSVFAAYKYYYGALFKTSFGKLELLHDFSEKDVQVKNKMKLNSLRIGGGYRLWFEDTYGVSSIGGWNCVANGVRAAEDYLAEFSLDMEKREFDKVFDGK